MGWNSCDSGTKRSDPSISWEVKQSCLVLRACGERERGCDLLLIVINTTNDYLCISLCNNWFVDVGVCRLFHNLVLSICLSCFLGVPVSDSPANIAVPWGCNLQVHIQTMIASMCSMFVLNTTKKYRKRGNGVSFGHVRSI